MMRIILWLVVLFVVARVLLAIGIGTAWSAFEVIAGFFLLCWLLPKIIPRMVRSLHRGNGKTPPPPAAAKVPPPPAFCPRCGIEWLPGTQRCSNCG